eukprot:scpid89337/ scgid7644/ 
MQASFTLKNTIMLAVSTASATTASAKLSPFQLSVDAKPPTHPKKWPDDMDHRRNLGLLHSLPSILRGKSERLSNVVASRLGQVQSKTRFPCQLLGDAVT